MKKKKVLTVLIAGSIALTGIFTPIGQKSVSASSEELISTAKSLIGVPYKWGGTTKNGFDCSGFLNYLFKSEHVSLPRTANDMYNRGTTISRSGLRAGDLVFFRTSSRAPVTHAGMYIGNGKFVHSSSSNGVAISDLDDKYYWGSRYVGAKRVTD